MKKICFVITSPLVLNAFLLDQLEVLCNAYEVTVCVNTHDVVISERLDPRVKIWPLNIKREISLKNDFLALFELIRLFKRQRFILVHSVTPKGGLLGMLAGLIARIPCRIHTYTGQVWVTHHGIMRRLLRGMDWLLAKCATHLLADSMSQREFLIQQHIVPANKINVLAQGSISGVSLSKFKPDTNKRNEVRQTLGLSEEKVLFLYLGRLTRDKGVLDLAQAFVQIASRYPQAQLIFIGPDEQSMAMYIQEISHAHTDRVRIYPPTKEPERYMAAADVYCLPSYREGFGTAIIEAAACATPAIATKIYGITDAVVEDKTGKLYPPGDIDALKNLMRSCCDQREIWKNMGEQAQIRAKTHFSSSQVTEALLKFYNRCLPSQAR